jgi:hypothetical protein
MRSKTAVKAFVTAAFNASLKTAMKKRAIAAIHALSLRSARKLPVTASRSPQIE